MVPKRAQSWTAVLALCLGSVGGNACAQQPASAPQKQERAAQKPQGNAPSRPSADENPFPADQSRTAAGQASPDAASPPSSTASQVPGDAVQPSTAADNPFPEDVSKKAAEDANRSAASSSPAGMSSSASRDPDLDRDMDRDTNRHRLPKPSRDMAPGSLSAVARAKQDVQVGAYYLSAANWKGAYARYLEATQDDPANTDAIFGLAEAARELGHAEEALANYKLYLDILPDGPKAKPARKALDTLAARK